MSDAPAMAAGYREIAPHPALRAHVECFWTVQGATAGQRILPDGCVDFLFDAARGPAGGRLIGAMTRAVAVPPAAASDLVGVRFHPGGARDFVRAPLSAFTDDAVDLTAVDRRLGEVARVGGSAAALAARVRGIEAWLLANLPPRGRLHGALTAFCARPMRIDATAAAAGLSRQHFTRLVREHTGLSPKLLARIRRLRRALADRSGTAAVQIALRHGFADQAHLARDVRVLTGDTWRSLRG